MPNKKEARGPVPIEAFMGIAKKVLLVTIKQSDQQLQEFQAAH